MADDNLEDDQRLAPMQDNDEIASDTSPNAEPVKRKSGPAWLALLVALGALGFSGWQYWQGLNVSNPIAEQDDGALDAAIASLGTELRTELGSELESELDVIRAAQGKASGSVDTLTQRLQQQESEAQRVQADLRADLQAASADDELQQLRRELRADISGLTERAQGLEQRTQRAEQSLVNLSDQTSGSEQIINLTETEYLLRLANERLTLFQDPESARRAMNLARDQLAAVDDPIYAGVRETLAGEIAKLESVELPPIVAYSGQLIVAADSVEKWPLANQRESRLDGMDNKVEGDGLWAKSQNVMRRLVVIERGGDPGEPQLTPAQSQSLRSDVQLELRMLRVALLERNNALRNQGAERVRRLIRQNFDTSSSVVQQAIKTLNNVADAKLSAELPEIGATLRQLRNLRNRATGAS